MVIVVTGATGPIGKNLVSLLKTEDNEVYSLNSKISNPQEKIFKIDLSNYSETKDFFDLIKPDICYHLAWCSHLENYMKLSDNYEWVNHSINLIECFSKYGKFFFFAGSCAQYAMSNEPLTESMDLINTSSSYSIAKNLFEKFGFWFSEQNGIKFISGRIFYAYGVTYSRQKIINYIIDQIISEQPIKISSKDSKFDFIHYSEIALITIQLCKVAKSGIYNIGLGNTYSIYEVIGIVCKYLDCDVYQIIEDKAHDDAVVIANMEKTFSTIGYSLEDKVENHISDMISEKLLQMRIKGDYGDQ